LIRELIERRGTLARPLTSKLLTTTVIGVATRPSPTVASADARETGAGRPEIVQIFQSINRGFNRRKLPSLCRKRPFAFVDLLDPAASSHVRIVPVIRSCYANGFGFFDHRS